MFRLKIAGYTFAVENHYGYVEWLCRNYITKAEPEEDRDGGDICVTEAEIAAENFDGGNWQDAYLESLAVYRKICERLLDRDRILFHSSALAVDGRAYLFTAPSGTGKSTHARLWRERFGDRVTMINDDKPILEIGTGEIRVYGTPWGGKDNLQTNTSARAAGIVILHQAAENTIRRISGREAYPMLLNQTYRRKDPEGMIHTLDLVESLSRLPVWSLGCTVSQEAVTLAAKSLWLCEW